jgi:hypothetical protein
MVSDIPTTYLGPFGWVLTIHWSYHAWGMACIWGVLAPAIILAIRFAKPRPRLQGTPHDSPKFGRELWWWTLHRYGFYVLMILSILGGAVAVTMSGGVSGSPHSVLGITTVLIGAFQVVVAWFRGTHGGKHGAKSDPNDPATWRGDHYDMTRRRRWFEAYHKSAGYLALATALGAISTGLTIYWVPSIYIMLVVTLPVMFAVFVILEARGFRQDTYQSLFGNHPDHPYNKANAVNINPDN